MPKENDKPSDESEVPGDRNYDFMEDERGWQRLESQSEPIGLNCMLTGLVALIVGNNCWLMVGCARLSDWLSLASIS
jgi:hypothetical protein